MKEPKRNPVSAFNSPLETGLRSLYILAVKVDNTFDLQELLAFDHLVVHTGDFENAPRSLHPSSPSRNGELVIRRRLVEQGLLLMESKGLIRRLSTSRGFEYQAEEFAAVLVEQFASPYLMGLRERSSWVVEHYITLGGDAFKSVFNHTFDRWASEFQFETLGLDQ